MKAATYSIDPSDSEFAFQSTPPVKAATKNLHITPTKTQFQSTPPVKAATYIARIGINKHGISIHAAREGGDEILDSVR